MQNAKNFHVDLTGQELLLAIVSLARYSVQVKQNESLTEELIALHRKLLLLMEKHEPEGGAS